MTLASTSLGTVLGSFVVTATFTEHVTGFDASDVSVTNIDDDTFNTIVVDTAADTAADRVVAWIADLERVAARPAERPIALDAASLVRKLVTEERGGYCFEQNTLLRAVLLRLRAAAD